MEEKGFIINREVFAERLSALIAESGETVYTLGEKLSLSPATISRYANGKMTPKVTTLTVLANIFDVAPFWLMGYDVEKKIPKPADYKHSIYLNEDERNFLIAYRSASPEIKEVIRRIVER